MGGVADQRDPPVGPARRIDLGDLVVVDRLGRRAVGQGPFGQVAHAAVSAAQRLARVYGQARVLGAVHSEDGDTPLVEPVEPDLAVERLGEHELAPNLFEHLGIAEDVSPGVHAQVAEAAGIGAED
jgi:hypothetical protein